MKTRITRLALVTSLSAIALANIGSASAVGARATDDNQKVATICPYGGHFSCMIVVTQVQGGDSANPPPGLKAAGDNTKPAIDGLHYLVTTTQK